MISIGETIIESVTPSAAFFPAETAGTLPFWVIPAFSTLFLVIVVLIALVFILWIQAKKYVSNLESMVEERTRQLRSTEHHLLAISEREQYRIGRELHDGAMQDLTAIAFMGDMLVDDLEGISHENAEKIQGIMAMVESTRNQIRNLSKGLAPINLEKIGLLSALQELATQVEQRYHITCIFHCDTEIEIPNQQVALNLYRIAQEAVNNSIKHSESSFVLISLSEVDGVLELMVEDDGNGFDAVKSKREGMGMSIMQYRSNITRSDLSIESNPGRGTRILCRLPMEIATSALDENR